MVYNFLPNFLRGARTFVYQSNCIDILGFCIGAVFTEKNGAYSRAHCPANANFNLIRSTYSKSNLTIESSAFLLLLILSVHDNLKAVRCCRALFLCCSVYFEQGKHRNNESKSKQHEVFFGQIKLNLKV